MAGNYLVCPDSAVLSVDTGERPRCRDDLGNDAWELHHTSELETFPDLSIADANLIGLSLTLTCATAWVWVKLRNVA